jgi:ribosomal protein S19
MNMSKKFKDQTYPTEVVVIPSSSTESIRLISKQSFSTAQYVGKVVIIKIGLTNGLTKINDEFVGMYQDHLTLDKFTKTHKVATMCVVNEVTMCYVLEPILK